MRIIAKRTLRAFWELYPDAEEPLLAWYREVEKEDWSTPQQLKEKYRNASIVKGSRAVFNIKGNDYRLVVKINYPYRVVYVRFVGSHADYDNINVEEV
jgi:mRNA interferase HigB